MTWRRFALAGLLAASSLLAQRLEFEVASLKPNQSGSSGYAIIPRPGGKLQATNINLKRLVAVAYSMTDFTVFGNISWFETQRYNLDAKAPGPASVPELRLMLRSLLEDRFNLKFHMETRELPRYALVPAKAETPPRGPGLKESPNGDCSATASPQAALPNGTPCGL
jgi:uncharacterized protein (TIGR03435 family)